MAGVVHVGRALGIPPIFRSSLDRAFSAFGNVGRLPLLSVSA